MSTNPPSLSAEMSSAIRQMIVTFREGMACEDLTVAIKAATEFGKLVASMKRAGIELPLEAEPASPPAPVLTSTVGSEVVRRQKAETVTSVFTSRPDDRVQSPHPPSFGGKPLTSFIGGVKPSPATTQPPIHSGPAG